MLVCASYVIERLHGPQRRDAYGTSQMYVFAGFAFLNGISACVLLSKAVRRSSTPHELYTSCFICGRTLAGIAGQLLVLGFSVPVAINDPDMARNHPYSPGVTLTAICWMALAACWSPRSAIALLGDASNEVRLREDASTLHEAAAPQEASALLQPHGGVECSPDRNDW